MPSSSSSLPMVPTADENTEILVDHETKEIKEPLLFHFPRECKFFLDQTENDPLTDDHDYFRKRLAVEVARFIGHSLREAMSYRIFSFENAFLHYFSNAKDVRYLSGTDLSLAFDKISQQLDEKLEKQLAAAKSRDKPFVPTLERVFQKLEVPDIERKVALFIFVFQNGPYYELANARCMVGREGKYQMMRSHFGRAGADSYLPPTLICHLFEREKLQLPQLMPMFKQSSKWVSQRLLPHISDPMDNTCNANDAMRLVIQGLPMGPSQYHSLESPTVQAALGEDENFLNSEAGKAHLALTGKAPEDAVGMNAAGRQDSSTGGPTQNKLREALANRKQGKDSVFDVLNMMRQTQHQPKKEGAETPTTPNADGGDAFPQESSYDGADLHVDPKGMMEKAGSAIFENDSTVSPESAKQQESKKDDEDDDSKMKLPYKNDLEYLEDQFQLLSREKAVVRNKSLLHEAVQSGKDNEAGGKDEGDFHDPYYGRHKPEVDKTKVETDLRKSKTRLTIHTELCKSRLRATAAAGSWYPRLELLVEAIGLTRFEKLVILDLIKSVISPDRDRMGGPFGRNRDLTISSLQEKFCSNLEERMACRKSFYKSGALIREGIVFISDADFMEDLSALQVDVDRRMLDFLVGIDAEVAEIVDGSHLYTPSGSMDDVILPEKDKNRILEVAKNFEMTKKKRAEFGMEEKYTKGFGSVLLLYGPPGTGKTQTANAIAKLLKKKVLLVNFPTLPPNAAGKILSFLFRESKLTGSLLFFDECESLFMSRDKGNMVVNMLLTEMERFDGLCILATNLPQLIDEAMYRRISVAIEFRQPDHILREKIWKTLRPDKLPVDDSIDYGELARRFEMTGGFIKNCWLSSLTIMIARKAEKITQEFLETAANEQILGRLNMSDFENKVTPSAGFESLVVNKDLLDSLKDIVNYSKAQSVLSSQWGFKNKNRGISVLFAGPSGTGKTIAASAIGYELGKPLKVINAAELMSKWVGETAKNIEAVFVSAKREDAILLFDEAEGIFGSRDADASRHDTVNVGVLLQHIENFKGVCIIITNMKERIDTAFFRRFRFVLTFEAPDVKLRKSLWRTIIPKECPLADDVNFEALAAQHELTGGQISSIVLRAATRAALRTTDESRKISMADLEKSCKEEEGKQTGNAKSVGMYI